jgi:FKBP-type peptidyl-prolyl cis-trans isomerase SlyD
VKIHNRFVAPVHRCEVKRTHNRRMKIQNNALVSIDVKMFDAQGELLEASSEPLTYLHGHEDIFPRLEAALEGHRAGDRLTVHLEPEDAFGEYDADLVLLVPLETLGEGVTVGSRIEGAPEGAVADAERRTFTVTEIGAGKAVLDGNHSLAGLALRVDITVIDVRPATADELAEAEGDVPTVPGFLSVAAPDGKPFQ